MKQKYLIISIVLYATAGLLLVYSIWSFTHCQEYILQMAAGGQLTISGNEFNIVSYYMANSIQYVVFAVMIFALAILIQKKSSNGSRKKPGDMHLPEYTINENNGDDFSDWFEKNGE